MDQDHGISKKGKKYLKKLVTDTPKSQQSQKVINQKMDKIQVGFLKGDLAIQGKPQKFQDLLEKKTDSSSIRFYLYTDRTKNRQMYMEMRKIRQQYSHQKTSLVVQEVQRKIKDWAIKQKIANKKRLQYFQQKIKEEQEIMEITKIQKQSWRKMQEINHHQEVMQRLQKLKQKKQQRQEQLKESNIKFKQTIEQVPLYILKQRQFRQKQHEQESKAKSMSKKNSTSFQVLNIKQHQKNYLQFLKQRQIRRQKSLSSLSRIKTPNYKLQGNQSKIHAISEETQLQGLKKKNQNPQTYSQSQSTSSKKFVTYFKLSQELKNEQEMKRQRRKQFVQKIKQLKPDQKLLSRIKARNSQEKIQKQMQDLQKKKKFKPLQSTIKKIGNQYLKQAVKNTQKVKKIQNSVSLPLIKQAVSRYPNYLTEFKEKTEKSEKSGRKIDQIQKVKQKYKEPFQVMQQLNKKSKQYEGTIIKKIKQLQKTQKYDDQLKKQVQIDQLFTKSLKMRLACLQIS